MSQKSTPRRANRHVSESDGSKYIVKDVLLTVKTQIRPSNTYYESVCGAGITSDGEWVRIFPFEWLNLPKDKQPAKYQWIRVPLEKRPKKDHRFESYKPDVTKMQLGECLPSDDYWRKRSKTVLPMRIKSVEEMLANKQSLGMIKPKNVLDLIIEDGPKDWGNKLETKMRQQEMFREKETVILRKVPYIFKYKFQCEDDKCTTTHKQTILDWEIYQLFEKVHKEHPKDIEKAKSLVRQKWLDEMWSEKRNSHLFLGTLLYKPKAVNVLGVYWPPVDPRAKQTTLFG